MDVAQAGEKVLVHALEGEPDSLDSAKSSTERANRVTWLLCDTLVNISKDGRGIEPGLAESWTLSEDGLQASIKLRSGVLFHDGTPLDAFAVKASVERYFQPGHKLYTSDPRNTKEVMLRDLVAGIEAKDGQTLHLKLKYPGLHYLSQVDIASPSALAALGKEFGRKPVCSGPFRFESWSKEQIVLTANDKYWAGRPKIDRVVFRLIPEAKAVVEALAKGEVDFSPVVANPVYLERVRESPKLRLVSVPGLNVFYLGFYTERPPLNNPRVRRALAQGINVSRMMNFLGRGTASEAHGPLSPDMKSYDPSVVQVPYDPQAARGLLGQAGQAQGLTLGLVHNSAVTFDAELAGSIQSDLRQIGVTVNLLGKPDFRDMVSAVRAREGDMFLYGWHLRAPYPERLLIPLFHSHSAGTSNLTHYKNPTLDKLLDEVVRLPEGSAQRRAYSQIQRLIVDDAPMLFLYHATRMAAYNKERVQGLELDLAALPHDKLVKVDLAP